MMNYYYRNIPEIVLRKISFQKSYLENKNQTAYCGLVVQSTEKMKSVKS